MPRRDRGGSGISDRALARTPQRKCQCGELVASSKKKYCWDCEAKAIDRRKRQRVKRKTAS